MEIHNVARCCNLADGKESCGEEGLEALHDVSNAVKLCQLGCSDNELLSCAVAVVFWVYLGVVCIVYYSAAKLK